MPSIARIEGRGGPFGRPFGRPFELGVRAEVSVMVMTERVQFAQSQMVMVGVRVTLTQHNSIMMQFNAVNRLPSANS